MMPAALAEQGCEAQLCSNCKKEIPAANFTTHELHCSRNIGVCLICKESFPKSEMRNHQEQEHTQVFCKCSMKMDQGRLQEHMALSCPLRTVACQHCDIELAFSKLREHEDYCGARTERCPRCRRHILVRELKAHPEDCGEEPQEASLARSSDPLGDMEAGLHGVQGIRNLLCPEDSALLGPKRNPYLESRLHNHLAGERWPREFARRNVAPSWPDRNRVPPEKTAAPSPFEGPDLDCHLDYLLALSLQQENGSGEQRAAEARREPWKSSCGPSGTRAPDSWMDVKDAGLFSPDTLVSDAPARPQNEALLPCEFCEELYPEEDLILHQTGCNPSTAFASFSKRGSAAPQSERFRDLWEQLQSRQPSGNREAPLLPRDEGPGDLMLPCEFCGVQLEGDLLFHHQDQCDLRPATALSMGKTLPQPEGSPVPAEDLETSESPDLPRRHLWNPGEIVPPSLEEVRRQKPPQASRPRGSMGPTWRTQATSLGNGDKRANNVGGPMAGKAKNPGPRMAGWDPSGPTPRRPSQTTYRPSFPGTAPTRPGLRTERRHSPTRVARYNNPKAKPWPAESDGPDVE